ncbi:hypothetical protein Tco_1009859 [Tanacetum coccineum]
MEEEEVPLVDGVLVGALGALEALEMEALVDAMLWWLIEDEKGGEVVICIWREFIRRKWFGNRMSLN